MAKKIVPLLLGGILLVLIISLLIPFAFADHGDWFGREHCPSVGCSSLPNFTNENRHFFGVDNGSIQVSNGFSASFLTDGYTGKVFLKSELDGKLITVDWQQIAFNNSPMNLRVYDGELDPTVSNQNGTGFFPTEGAILNSFVTVTSLPVGSQPRQFDSGTPNLSGFTDPSGKVTLMVFHDDTNTTFQISNRIFGIEIEDIGLFNMTNVPSFVFISGFLIGTTGNAQTLSFPIYGTWLSIPPADVIPPVISGVSGEPVIFYDGDSVFDRVQCTDDLEVFGHSIGNFATDGAVTIDGEDAGLQSQDFTCTDEEGNVSLVTLEYLVKRSSTGGGDGGTTSTSIPPPLSSPTPSTPSDSGTPLLSLTGDDRSVDDFFSLLSNLFQRGLDSETGQAVQDRVQETTTQARQQATERVEQQASDSVSSFLDFIFGFFR